MNTRKAKVEGKKNKRKKEEKVILLCTSAVAIANQRELVNYGIKKEKDRRGPEAKGRSRE